MEHQGKPLPCDCPPDQDGVYHRRVVMAVVNGRLEVWDHRHGTLHTMNLTVQQLVALLDPRGTSYQAVGSAR